MHIILVRGILLLFVGCVVLGLAERFRMIPWNTDAQKGIKAVVTFFVMLLLFILFFDGAAVTGRGLALTFPARGGLIVFVGFFFALLAFFHVSGLGVWTKQFTKLRKTKKSISINFVLCFIHLSLLMAIYFWFRLAYR